MTTAPRTFTAAEIRALERPLLDAGVPLMARAAEALADHVSRRLRSRPGSPGGPSGQSNGAAPHREGASLRQAPRIMLLVGGGNNGGDALIAGAALARGGSAVEIVPTSDRMHSAGLDAALAAGARIVAGVGDDPAEVAATAASADAIVDGILGLGRGGADAGGSPALRGRARDLVAATVRAIATTRIRPFVIAVDLPSGIDPDSGAVSDPDAVLTADVTVTFIGVKTGLVRQPASRFAGDVVLERIGVEAG